MTNEQIRTEFEEWITSPPYELSITKYPDDPSKAAWPKCYRDIKVQIAWDAWQERGARYAGSGEETIQRLRGQLQNCVNHIERLKRHHPRETEKLEACVQSANKCLYETLHGINPPAQPKVPDDVLIKAAAYLKQAAEDVADWGAYSDAYFQNKHNLAFDVQLYKDRAAEFESMLSAQENNKTHRRQNFRRERENNK